MNGQVVALAPAQLAPHGSSVLYISKDIGRLGPGWQKNAVGGITVAQDGPAGALNTGGWIEDDHLGYSTTITFADPTRNGTSLMGT
jgi:hypothetical protein